VTGESGGKKGAQNKRQRENPKKLMVGSREKRGHGEKRGGKRGRGQRHLKFFRQEKRMNEGGWLS